MGRLFFAALCLCCILTAITTSAAERGQPLNYAVVKADKDTRSSGRTRLTLRIMLAEMEQGKIVPRADQTGLTKEQLAATVVAAAKYYAQHTGAHMVGVVLDGGYGTPAAHIQLARVNYAPDGKGATGSEAWTWNDLRAAERGLTPEEQRDGGYLPLKEVPTAFTAEVPPVAGLNQ